MKYDIFSTRQQVSTLKLEGGKITSLKKTDLRRHGARRFENGLMFQSSRVGNTTEERLLADTREWGGPGTPHDYGFAPAHSEKRQGVEASPETLQRFEEAAQQMIARHPEFVFNGGCKVYHHHASLKSNYGLDLETTGGACEWHFVYQRRGSGNVFDGHFHQEVTRPDIFAEVQRHTEFLEAQKKTVKMSSGRYPVLFSYPETPLQKLLESFTIRRYKEGSCVFAGKLDQTLFSPKVTLLDSAYDPEQGQIQFFDGEGTVRKDPQLKLIDHGRFASLISDLRFGKKYGHASTGNGMRSYNTGVNVGLRSLRFATGTKPWREVLRGLDRCLVVSIAAGGDSNDLGEFSSPVQVSYLFEKGECVGLAPQITVKTSVADYLGRRLIDVSKDGFTPGSPSACVISEMDVLVN